ncbi:cytochrome P450 [Nocardioides nematodiphilus]|uniref:cytochrome P450 n=1 Tax=Nocardioides nematodiphilus TaxID=2849669 RepID=UPI001CDA1250|nr:cytochrome P450 [Nocardioides nematodiphilus]MCA1981323.1 cytochrome P450 [Nocardioides nematodiphilus]
MVTVGIKERVRKLALRWAMRGKSSVMPDITTLRKVPEHITYPLRREGADPVPALAEAREQGPVTLLGNVLGLDIFLVTSYAAAKKVLADSSAYSNDMRHLLGSKPRSEADEIGGLGFTDAPDHTRLRGLLTPEFTMRRLQRLQEPIDRIVEEALDRMAAGGTGPDAVVDLADSFGFEVPFQVICELLGLPTDVRDEFHALGAARFDISEGGVGAFGATAGTRTFLIDQVRRQRTHPGDGLIGEIIRTRGDEFSDLELGGLADGAFIGGYETSAAMLSMGTYVLLQRPEMYELLRTGDADAVNSIIDELLRYLCPVQIAFPRFAREDHDLFGTHVAKGSVVVVSLSGANRDPEAMPAPEDFDLRNRATSHLAFGHGMHRCVGAELARMEMRAALTALSRRFPNLAMATDDPGELGFRDLSIVYGLDRLPVALDRSNVSV